MIIKVKSNQSLVANRVQELGAGMTLNKHHLSAIDMRAALLEVLTNPSYKEQACIIGESLRQAGGYQKAAEMIMSHMDSIDRNLSNTKFIDK
ncbi:hypothetical protein QCD85_08405 [Paenibacillus sp. PsM32]|uniref:hypothetical protein n=1 Tax=Paenibacillus sp. PsM32 TaxID=3030536 RepID=UPI00263AFEAA|nr:hypothetical protein [Paenibacillus sp. PsM32]MDN4618116.1 hypothetical protein [Paenibacillus sp. PsM32]